MKRSHRMRISRFARQLAEKWGGDEVSPDDFTEADEIEEDDLVEAE